MFCHKLCFGDQVYLLNEQEPFDLFVNHLVVGSFFMADLIVYTCNN